MAVFIEKSPVTSSNCYKTKITASILIKLGTNVNWTIAFVTTCSVLNFLLPWQREDISKLTKITVFIFSHSQVQNFLGDEGGGLVPPPFKPPNGSKIR
jgi:hypothetical protein